MAEALTTTLVLKALEAALKKIVETATGEAKIRLKAWYQSQKLAEATFNIDEIGLVRTIGKSEKVRFESFYFAPRVSIGRVPGSINQIHSLADIAPTGNVLLHGTVGQGKSIFMRYLCLGELSQGLRIPIFAELRMIDTTTGLKKLILSRLVQLGLRDIDEKTLLDLLASGHFLFLLDGFDEVRREFAFGVQRELRELMASSPNSRWIISTRPGAYRDLLAALPRCIEAKLSPIEIADFESFFLVLGAGGAKAKELVAAIEVSNSEIRGVLTTPLMLTLLFLTCGNSAKLADSLHQFYQELFSTLLIRHDEAKGLNREYATSMGSSDLQELFSAFCYVSKDFGIALSDGDFEMCVKKAAAFMGKSISASGFRAELVDTICLMQRDGLKTAFIHPSVQAFFAATFVKNIGEEPMVKTLYDAIRKVHFMNFVQEIRFLEKLDPFRFALHYRIPVIDEFRRIALGKMEINARITKIQFDKFTKSLDAIYIEAKGRPGRVLIGADHARNSVYPEWLHSIAGTVYPWSRVRLIKLISDAGIKMTNLSTYYKSHPQDRDTHYGKFVEFCAKIQKERHQMQTSLDARKSSFGDLVK